MAIASQRILNPDSNGEPGGDHNHTDIFGESRASGQSVTLTASVTPAGATGSITFKDGPSTVGAANLRQGMAGITLTLNGGTHTLTAVYSGDQNNGASTSSTLNETISLPTLTITTSSLPSGCSTWRMDR